MDARDFGGKRWAPVSGVAELAQVGGEPPQIFEFEEVLHPHDVHGQDGPQPEKTKRFNQSRGCRRGGCIQSMTRSCVARVQLYVLIAAVVGGLCNCSATALLRDVIVRQPEHLRRVCVSRAQQDAKLFWRKRSGGKGPHLARDVHELVGRATS